MNATQRNPSRPASCKSEPRPCAGRRDTLGDRLPLTRHEDRRSSPVCTQTLNPISKQ